MTRPPWPSIVSVALLVVLAWPVTTGACESLQLSVPPFDVPASGAVLTTASLMAESVADESDGAAPAMWRVEDPLPALRLAAMQDPAAAPAEAAAPAAAEAAPADVVEQPAEAVADECAQEADTAVELAETADEATAEEAPAE
jgi:hypothetical protein